MSDQTQTYLGKKNPTKTGACLYLGLGLIRTPALLIYKCFYLVLLLKNMAAPSGPLSVNIFFVFWIIPIEHYKAQQVALPINEPAAAPMVVPRTVCFDFLPPTAYRPATPPRIPPSPIRAMTPLQLCRCGAGVSLFTITGCEWYVGTGLAGFAI